MILGIDPKNDYAFKRVFGSAAHTGVLIHLLNAVLKYPAGKKIASVQLQNPITDPVKLDDKLSILDIYAFDETGRRFNIEMQILAHPAFRERLLYYWAKAYSSQMVQGEDYSALRPVISICFLNSVLYANTGLCHLPFRIWNTEISAPLTDHYQLHLFQLPRFTKSATELVEPLDKWLYFLNNGKELDPNQLPAQLQDPEVLEAVEILKMMTQSEQERILYEAREKALRDQLYWERIRNQAIAEAERSKAQAEQAQAQTEQAQAQTEQARQETRDVLIKQIHFAEDLLKRDHSPEQELHALSVEILQERLQQLQNEIRKL
jgi:predicted transposase/invertase (TIGR01784 family)